MKFGYTQFFIRDRDMDTSLIFRKIKGQVVFSTDKSRDTYDASGTPKYATAIITDE